MDLRDKVPGVSLCSRFAGRSGGARLTLLAAGLAGQERRG